MEGGKIGVIPTQASHRGYGGGKIGVIPTQVGYCGYGCTSQQKVDTFFCFYTSFSRHSTPYTVLESDNSESMQDVLH